MKCACYCFAKAAFVFAYWWLVSYDIRVLFKLSLYDDFKHKRAVQTMAHL